MIQAHISTGRLDAIGARLGLLPEKIQEDITIAVAEWIRKVIRGSFEQQETAEGVPWRPLSPKYAARKRGPGILRETGAMFEQSTRAPAIEGNTITVGSTLPYAAAHQFGFYGEVEVREFVRRVRTGKDTFGKLFNPELRKETRQIIARGVRFDKVGKHTRRMNIPARPYLPSPAFVEAEGTKMVQEFVEKTIAEATSE